MADNTYVGRIIYRDLPEFGLPLLTPGDPMYDWYATDIEGRSRFFEPRPSGEPGAQGVLLNQSGKAIVTLACIWQYSTNEGNSWKSRFSNLGSSRQIDVLCGRAGAQQDTISFILPRSCRLITEHGMFGNNLDVLPPDFAGRGGGSGSGSGGGRRPRQGLNEEITEIEMCLDAAILEDGICVGPDNSGLFASVIDDVEQQRHIARLILTALRNGSSDGALFEILRPWARPFPPGSMGRGNAGDDAKPRWSAIVSMFANTAIRRLTNASGSELLPWFEEIAETTPLRLYRPS